MFTKGGIMLNFIVGVIGGIIAGISVILDQDNHKLWFRFLILNIGFIIAVLGDNIIIYLTN
jgi:hypothetical protein